MIKIDKGESHLKGDVNLLINEMAIGLMVVCEMVSERMGITEEDVLDTIMLSLQGQKLGRSGMSIEDLEDVLNVEIDKKRTNEMNEGAE